MLSLRTSPNTTVLLALTSPAFMRINTRGDIHSAALRLVASTAVVYVRMIPMSPYRCRVRVLPRSAPKVLLFSANHKQRTQNFGTRWVCARLAGRASNPHAGSWQYARPALNCSADALIDHTTIPWVLLVRMLLDMSRLCLYARICSILLRISWRQQENSKENERHRPSHRFTRTHLPL